MPFPSEELHPRPRRDARSLDFDDSAATKAAAWVWYLHDSKPGISTEGRFLSSQSRRRSRSSSSDRGGSRFRQEASESSRAKACGAKFETPMWDCGSNLYDAFELVALGNRLDQSLMESVLPAAGRTSRKDTKDLLLHDCEPSGMRRTVSLTSRSSAEACQQTSKKHSERVSLSKARESSFTVYAQNPASKRWPNVGKLMKAFKKVVDSHKQMGMNVGCKSSINVAEPSCQRPLEPQLHASTTEEKADEEFIAKKVRSISHDGTYSSLQQSLPPLHDGSVKTRRTSLDDGGRLRKGGIVDPNNAKVAQGRSPAASHESHTYHKHLHHHHHHHHHHYLHRAALGSQSARLSPETLSRISADKSWITSSKS